MPNAWNTMVQKCAAEYRRKKNVKRGRPVGSKNKPKETAPAPSNQVAKRRGRPPKPRNQDLTALD